MKKDNTKITMFFCMNILQTTFFDKSTTANIRVKNLANCAVMAWLNYNNTTSFSKFFQFLPLVFDIFISVE